MVVLANPQTPEEWLHFLERKLADRAIQVEQFEKYYQGDHPLAFASSKYREAFGNLLTEFADNWCRRVVDTPVQRLSVTGFGGDASAAERAWSIWNANDMETQAAWAHTEAVKHGVAYATVDPFGETPRIDIDHPLQTIVHHSPENRRVRQAALKKWRGTDGFVYANVYFADSVFKFKSSSRQAIHHVGTIAWQRIESLGNPLGVVPIVPIENNLSLLHGGTSDLIDVIPLNDLLNKLMNDLTVASEFQAYRQRVITGVEIPKDPETGELLATVELKAAISRFLTFESPDVKVSELGQLDLQVYTNAVETVVNHIAALTAIPPHYLMGKVVNASGDALTVAETGLVFKVKSKQRDFGSAWSEVLRLCFLASGEADNASHIGRPIWANPEQRQLSQLADAISKLDGILPVEEIYALWGGTPEEIKKWVLQRGLPPRDVLPDAAADPALAA